MPIIKASDLANPNQAQPPVADEPQGNFIQKPFDDISHVTPEQRQGHGRLVNAMQDFGASAIGAASAPLVHPWETAKAVVDTAFPPLAMLDASIGKAPMQELVKSTGQDFRENGPQAGIAHVLGGATGGYVGGELGAGAIRAIPGVKQFLKPTPSESVVSPAEMASRKLAKAVLPSNKDAANFINASPLEVPNVLKFAKESNNPLNTQLEFSKAAQGNAQTARDFYENKILKPFDKQVKTTGTGFGRRMGEGPDTYANLSEIDKRIVDLNKQLDAPALNSDDMRRALASKTDLQAEAAKLKDILHTNLSQDSGVPVEDIANLRQRVGRSYELANDTNAAVTGRMQGEGRAALGDLSWSKVPARLLEKVMGGPTAIADRSFQRAIKAFPGEAQPFPEIKPPQQAPPPPLARTPIRAASTELPTFDATPDAEAIANQSNRVAARNLAKRLSTEANQKGANQEFLHSNNLEQAAQDAAAQRAQRVSNFRTQRDLLKKAQTNLEGEAVRAKGRQNFK